MKQLSMEELNKITEAIIGAAIEVHKHLGPGLLENVYHKCLIKELSDKGFSFQSELTLPINYKGIEVEANLKCDLFVENCLVVELKAIAHS